MSGAPYDREHDPYWAIIQANYTTAELHVLSSWADARMRLEQRFSDYGATYNPSEGARELARRLAARRTNRFGWSRRVDR